GRGRRQGFCERGEIIDRRGLYGKAWRLRRQSSGYNHTLQLTTQTYCQLDTGKDTVVDGRLQGRLDDVTRCHTGETCHRREKLLLGGVGRNMKQNSGTEPIWSNMLQCRT